MRIVLWVLALVAVATGLTMWKAARHERLAEAEWPPEGDFVVVDGVRVHYVTAGSGPDLVLIHGASGNTRDFTFEIMAALSDRYRVIAFDRPGMGYTGRINPEGADTIFDQADVLQAAAAALGVERPLVFGHSYGGSVALAWALRHPEAMAGLTLSAAPSQPWGTGLGLYYTVLSHPLGRRFVIPAMTAWVPESVVDDAIDGVFAPQSAPPGYHAAIGAGLSLRRVSMRANALHRAGLLAEVTQMQPRYGEIDMPVELIHGDADTTVPLSIHSLPLSTQIPDANLRVLEGIGHMPHHSARDETLAAIDRMAVRAGLR